MNTLQSLLGNRKVLFLLAVLVFAPSGAGAQNLGGKDYRQLSDFPFVLVSEETVITPPQISDSLFDAASRGIRFKVNRTDIQSTDPFISIYREQLLPWLKQHDMQLRQVFVKGAASPEGPYQNNVRLSRERTQKLIDFISTGLGQALSTQPVDASSITEDYGQLVRLLQKAGDADYERVSKVWQDCKGDEACCKRRLMALDNGKLWERLKSEYFPDLRQARVILWFAKKPDAVPTERTMLTQLEGTDIPMPAAESFNGILPELLLEQQEMAYTRRHLIAVRTNLLHDLLYVPQFGWAYGVNAQLEYYPLRGHYTYNAGFTFSNHRHWNDYKFFQMRDLRLELRRYFKGGGVFTGTYLGVYGEGTVYGIGFSKTKGWEGEGGGAGLSIGCTWPLNRKGNLRLEVSASLGFFYTRYDPYIYGDPFTKKEDGLYYYDYYGNSSDFKERNHQFTWLGPTDAGIHITYDIVYRKKKPVGLYGQEGGMK